MKWQPGALLAQCLFLATLTVLRYPLAAAAAAEVPVYPAAQTRPLPPGAHPMVVSRCGRTFTVVKSMSVDADPRTVAKWYQSRLSGSRAIDLSRALSDEGGGGNSTTTIQVFTADGSRTVVISRTQFDGALAKASKTLGMDKTDIGIEGISPALSPAFIALEAQAAAGGASGQQARKQLKAGCNQ